jgi:hypothetical protein
MQNNTTVRSGALTYRWDGEQLWIASGEQQIIIPRADVLPLANLLDRLKEELYRQSQDLPKRVPEQQHPSMPDAGRLEGETNPMDSQKRKGEFL